MKSKWTWVLLSNTITIRTFIYIIIIFLVISNVCVSVSLLFYYLNAICIIKSVIDILHHKKKHPHSMRRKKVSSTKCM